MSLIEVLIAMVMATGIILAMFGVVPYACNKIQVNSTQVQAVAIGQQYLDALRNAKQSSNPLPTATSAPIDQGDSFFSANANSSTALFTITPNTCPQRINGGTISQYDCIVVVTWTENNESKSTQVENYVTAP